MEHVKVDGTPFSILMDRAVRIKRLQSGRDMVKYDAFPAFYANTIYPNEEVSTARRCSTFQEQLVAAYRMKEEGNEAFRNEYFPMAMTKYGMAVSVFRYLENANPNWKSQGTIEDRFIQEIDYECKDETERHNLNQLLYNCYTNIAVVSCKLKDYPLAIQACDFAISVNGQNDKAYFIRAMARLTPKNSGLDDQQMARSDLLMSLTLNPKNKEAKQNLHMLISEIKMQKDKDENIYKGLFDRVEIYEQRELNESKKDRGACTMKTILEAKQRDIVMGRQLAQLYNEQGMIKEQERIEQSIQDEIASMEKLNFRIPSPQMILEANSMGVNLNDPWTVDLLEKTMDDDCKRIGQFGIQREKTKTFSSPALLMCLASNVENEVIAILSCMVIAGCIVVYLN